MLGYSFDNLDIKDICEDDFAELRKAVPTHGVICIKNQNLTIDALIALTRKFGEPVLLPEGLRFNNTIPDYPELARVSNLSPDGTLIKKHQAAEYWHVDGDFWQPGQNYIYNFLYSVKVPERGGKTGFIDMRKAYQALTGELKKEIENLSFLSSCKDIPDFKVASPEEYLPDAYHKIKHKHIETELESIYINYPTTQLLGKTAEESAKVLADLFEIIEAPEHGYEHDWQVGDLLIWDNTSVMHRSLGGYYDSPRLLYRTQAFMQPL